ncbi:MAG: glutathione S-transferase [Gammaproteobacteria bacterium]
MKCPSAQVPIIDTKLKLFMHHNHSVLYSFRRCPYAMRARLALVYAGIDVELREVRLANKPQALLEVSAKATVPVLVLDDGRIIDESLDIMLWALKQNDPEHWLAESKEQQAMTQNLIHENDFEFKIHLDHYKYSDRFLDYAAEHYRNQGEQFILKLEQQLNGQSYLTANHATLADYAIYPFIRQFAYVDKAWFDQAAYPKLRKWLNNFLDSQLFHTTMKKYEVWEMDKEPVFFP